MSTLNLAQLKAFLTVVRLGRISTAAQALHLTQPAMTTRIKNLEAAVGAELFTRTPNGIVLTKRGSLLRRYAEQIEQVSERITAEVLVPNSLEGLLRLGVSETIAQSWLPDFVSTIYQQYPGIEIEINVDISLNLQHYLLQNKIDLAVLLGPVSEPAAHNITLPKLPLAWYCPAKMELNQMSASDLLRLPIITYARNTRPFNELKNMLLEKIGPSVSFFPSSSLSACFRLVESGLGVAALPRLLGQDFVIAGKVREFSPGWTPSPLNFTASYLDEPKSHMVEAIATLAQTVAKNYAKEKKEQHKKNLTKNA